MKNKFWMFLIIFILNLIGIGFIVMFIIGMVAVFGLINLPLWLSITFIVIGAVFGVLPYIKRLFGGKND